MPEPDTLEDRTRVEEVLQRVANDLSMITDRPLELDHQSISAERQEERAAGAGCIHISFKLGYSDSGQAKHGCLLVPLPDAIALAGYMMMLADDDVAAKRELSELDGLLKDAMLEVGNFISGAVDVAMRPPGEEAVMVSSEGCQGVRADVRPAFEYEEGSELLVGRASMTLHEFDPFEVVLMIPS